MVGAGDREGGAGVAPFGQLGLDGGLGVGVLLVDDAHLGPFELAGGEDLVELVDGGVVGGQVVGQGGEPGQAGAVVVAVGHELPGDHVHGVLHVDEGDQERGVGPPRGLLGHPGLPGLRRAHPVRGLDRQREPELGHRVVVVGQEEVPGPGPHVLGQGQELLVVVDLDDLPVGVHRRRVREPLLPELRGRRGAQEQAPVDADPVQALGALLGEHVLRGLGAQALAEDVQLRALVLGDRASRHFRACRNALFWSMPIPTRNNDNGDGRSEYCIATSAMSPRVRNSNDSAVT